MPAARPVIRRRRLPRASGLCALLLCGFCGAQAQSALDVAWRDPLGGGIEYRALDAQGHVLDNAVMPQQVPLGSLWKLFVFAWLTQQPQPAPDYLCQSGKNQPDAAARGELISEEAYCCEPGHTISRDQALVKSCGLFFAPKRLGIAADDWRHFWYQRAPAIDWLADLSAMRPETTVSLPSLLAALEAVPAPARIAASNILLSRVVESPPAVRFVGGQLRIKTFSWFYPGSRQRYGGGAGWLIDGTPVWFGGGGTGQLVLARQAALLARTLPTAASALPAGCVEVDFFTRYPLKDVRDSDNQPAAEGRLNGRYVALFRNDVSLPFNADGKLWLRRTGGVPTVHGRFGLNEYVARALDREADATHTEAAGALSVVIRSYLLNEARPQGNCLRIADDSRTQRVSPSPPSAAARQVADFTSDLILRGQPVYYHTSQSGPGRLSWQQAVQDAAQGKTWDQLLLRAFPQASLTTLHDPAGLVCERLPLAEQWLARQSPRWQPALQVLPGFETPSDLTVCRLAFGSPFAELERNRIHARALRTEEDRITLAHEYLHLAFRHHPSGRDEHFIETWARRLVRGDPP